MSSVIPSAPRRPHTWIRPTTTADDPYAWLRDPDDLETQAYLVAENAYADNWFGIHAETTEQFFTEIRSRVQEDDSAYPVQHRNWWYTSRTETGQSYPIHSRGLTPDSAQQHTLLDENVEAGDAAYFSINAFEISHNERFLAWSSDTDGSEKFMLRIRDLDTGQELPDEIPNTTWGGVAWSSDDNWLFYVTPDDAMRPWQVWRHRVGTPVGDDVIVYQDADERFFVGVGITRSDKWIIIETASRTSSECHLINAYSPTDSPQLMVPRSDDLEYQVEHWDSQFAILTNRDAVDFQVMTAPENDPTTWTTLIHHQESQRITQFDCFEGHAVMQRWINGQQVISVVDSVGHISPISILDEPHDAEIESNPNYATDGVRLTYQSLTTPRTTAWFSMTDSQLVTLKRNETPHCDLSSYVAERLWAVASDGARIPVDIVRHVTTPLDGTAPLSLYVYGAYESSLSPWFSVARLSLLDRGWVWALAHPRGGGEMGRSWYDNGKLLHKKNTFTDTLATASFLADSQICDGTRMVIRGGSAGGLTVGACITMDPARFVGAIAEVPFVDVVTTMSDPSLPLTVTEWEEWGDPRQEPFASYIESYSPYDNTGSVVYPRLYVSAGLNDPRVSFHEPAKWVAKIRHESPSTFVIFKCEMGAGHGGPSGRYEQWRDEAKTLAFTIAAIN